MTGVILNSGAVPVYANFASFPGSAADGSLAVASDTESVYEFSVALNTWTLIGPGGGGGGSGTVTSVAVSAPAEFIVSGSPVTTSGTISITKADESANTVWAGPVSGSDAQPAFRALVLEDLPSNAQAPYFVNEFTLSGTDITNKFVTLTTAPVNPTLTVLAVVGGPTQEYSVDYSISSTTLNWSGLGLDGVLTAGDILVVQLS